MTKLEATIARAQTIARLQTEEARIRGALARAHNRPNTGVLVPKLEASLLAAWHLGWSQTDAALSGE